MGDKRQTLSTLRGTRIYARNGHFQYLSPEPILDPKTGKLSTWVRLCPIADGEAKARTAKDVLLGCAAPVDGDGDFAVFFKQWRKHMLGRRALKTPKDPARAAIWDNGTKTLESVYNVIERGFSKFDVNNVRPSDVALFLDQWEGRRSAVAYRGHLSSFFKWCCKKGYRESNPAEASVIELESVPKRNVYITQEQFAKVRDALVINGKGKSIDTGKMVQAYIDLTYLLGQRSTDVRLLRRNDVDETAGHIFVKPTKTEQSSGGSVYIKITPAIAQVLDRIKQLSRQGTGSVYLIHTRSGQPYTGSGIRSAWNRACKRVGVAGITVKDIRHMSASDAKRAGASLADLQIRLVHTREATTLGYVSGQDVPVSSIDLQLPSKKKGG